MGKVLAILRAERFSPNSVEKDRAIMAAVVERLKEEGHEADVVSEEELEAGIQSGSVSADGANAILTMGRLPQTQVWLKKQTQTRIVNRPEGIERCARSTLTRIMQQEGIPMPPADGNEGYWLKRGDAAAQERGDVVFAADKEELNDRISDFSRRGISDYTVSAHVTGDLVKFYGVRGSGFFRYFYPTDDGDTKFDDEQHNGRACHYEFSVANLHGASERLAAAVGIDVYGGDCIVKADGRFCIIDFNDWPSFSRCREEAATAIAGLLTNKRKD